MDEETQLPPQDEPEVHAEWHTLDELTADPFQTREHDDRNLGMIQKSIERVGMHRSTVVDEDLMTLAGNGTTQAARAAGVTRALVIDVPSDVMLVRRVKGLSAQQKLYLATMDNRSTDTSRFDPQALQVAVQAGLQWEDGWTPDEFEPILNAEWHPPSEGDMPEREHDNGTGIHLSIEQYALLQQVKTVIDEETQGSDEINDAKAVEFACRVFLNQRKTNGRGVVARNELLETPSA